MVQLHQSWRSGSAHQVAGKLPDHVRLPPFGRADHVRKRLLADFRDKRLRFVFLAKVRQQREQPGKPFLARIEQLIDEVCFDADRPAQKMGNEHLGERWFLMDHADNGRFSPQQSAPRYTAISLGIPIFDEEGAAWLRGALPRPICSPACASMTSRGRHPIKRTRGRAASFKVLPPMRRAHVFKFHRVSGDFHDEAATPEGVTFPNEWIAIKTLSGEVA
jgi:hypothetical protein